MISLEEIIFLVVKEVVKELTKRGVQITGEISNISAFEEINKKIEIDMNKYKTPLLTEKRILEIDNKITEIEIPQKTIITPSAFDLIKQRKIKITRIK